MGPVITPPNDVVVDSRSMSSDVAPVEPLGRSGRFRRPRATAWLPLPAVAVIVAGFVLPLLVVLLYSVQSKSNADGASSFTLEHYIRFLTTDTYWQSLVRTVVFVGASSLITVAVAFPMAYFVATKAAPHRRMLWILLATIPFLTSYLIRVIAWVNLLGSTGLINSALLKMGLIDEPLGILSTGAPAIIITFTYLLFPLVFLTAFISLERVDPAIYEAASDLGAGRWRRFVYVTLPLCRNGAVGGFVLAFIAMLGDYVTPQMVGGTSGTLYSNLIINQFGNSMQWGFGSALALIMLVSIFLLLALLRIGGGTPTLAAPTGAYVKRRSPLLTTYAGAVIAFLYLPMALLTIFAFNDSRSVGLPFNGFTTDWFAMLFENASLLSALETSMKVAGATTVLSLVMGTAAALYVSRAMGSWRNLSLATISLPLFLPPVILGMAIIIGLNAIGIERGLWTIILGHTIITLPLVMLIVIIRLEGLDRNLELAAQDLGARPLTVFAKVLLPQLLPAIVAAAMIVIATSLDEFILTFLVTGTDTTLPLYIFGSIRFGLSPELVALATVILGVSLSLLILGTLVAVGRQGVKRPSRKV